MLDKSTRTAALNKIAKFLTDDKVTEDALENAFEHAEGFRR